MVLAMRPSRYDNQKTLDNFEFLKVKEVNQYE